MAFKCAGVPFTDLRATASKANANAFAKATGALDREGLPLKIHHEKLQHLFLVVRQQFDLVCFDSGSQAVRWQARHNSSRELFVAQRLAPLRVVLNNFCESFTRMEP